MSEHITAEERQNIWLRVPSTTELAERLLSALEAAEGERDAARAALLAAADALARAAGGASYRGLQGLSTMASKARDAARAAAAPRVQEEVMRPDEATRPSAETGSRSASAQLSVPSMPVAPGAVPAVDAAPGPQDGAALAALRMAREALEWCGGAGDFSADGRGRIGWERIGLRAIDAIDSVLAQGDDGGKRALAALAEACGMYCEQLPAPVQDALHALPWIAKVHGCAVLAQETGGGPMAHTWERAIEVLRPLVPATSQTTFSAIRATTSRRSRSLAREVSVESKAAYVKAQPQTRAHHCHWPGCEKQVPPAMWGCRPHWFALPKALRDRIWATYRPGQERTMDPSGDYLDAADAVQAWIAARRPVTGEGGERRG